MKKLFHTFTFLSLVALLITSVIFSGCKKDDDENQPEPKSYRIKTMSYNDAGDIYLITLTYNSDNRLLKMSETVNGEEIYRNDFVWNGNQVVITNSYLDDNGMWITEDSRQVITYTNGKVSKNEFQLSDTLSLSTTYTWNGDLLQKEAGDFVFNGMTFTMNIDYIYENGLLTTANHTFSGMVIQKDVIEYENGKAVALKTYDDQNNLTKSSAILYTDSRISQVSSFNIVEGVQGDVDCTESRTYDNNGCVNFLSTLCQGETTPDETNVVNEEGKSNLNDIILTQAGWITAYLFPDTYPSDLVMKKKK